MGKSLSTNRRVVTVTKLIIVKIIKKKQKEPRRVEGDADWLFRNNFTDRSLWNNLKWVRGDVKGDSG